MPKSKVTFDTFEYQKRYGRAPRGRGGWAFIPTEKYNGPEEQASTKFFQGTFDEARKRARTYFETAYPGVAEIEITVGT